MVRRLYNGVVWTDPLCRTGASAGHGSSVRSGPERTTPKASYITTSILARTVSAPPAAVRSPA